MMRFVVQTEGRPEKSVELDVPWFDAGSAVTAPLSVDDLEVAPWQFRVETTPEGLVVSDLGSGAPTRLNGASIGRARLSVGDVVEAGRTRIVFAADTAGVSTPAAPPAPAAAAPPAAGPTAVPPSLWAAPPRMPRTERAASPAALVVFSLLLLGAIASIVFLREPSAPVRPWRAVVRIPDAPAPAPGRQPDGSAPGAAFDPGVVVPAQPIPAEPEDEPGTPGPADAPAAPDRPEDPVRPAPNADEVARAAAEKERMAREAGHRAALESGARERLRSLDRESAGRVGKFAFAETLVALRELLPTIPEGELRGEALGRIDDLTRASRAFDRFRSLLAKGDRRVRLSSGLTLAVTGADAEGFTAKVSGAEVRKRFTELDPPTVHGVLAEAGGDAEAWLDTGAFAAVFGLPESEGDLARAFGLDPGKSEAVSEILARRRGIPVPEGGFVLHEGEWVTKQEKGYLEQGLVKHDGAWMTKEEALTAQGWVKHNGRWLSPEDYAEILEAEKEAEDLAKKYLPKGLIDEPGNGDAVPWDKATEIKTTHYRVRTNLSGEVARDIAYTMEILRTNLASQFGLRGKGATFTINVVATLDEYRKAWPQAGGSLGFCSTSEICTFYQPPMTTAVLMHEGTHQTIRRVASACPRWLHEGLATYFECSRFSFDAERKKVRLEVGLLNAMRLANFQQELNEGKAVSIETFMTGKGGNPYSQGWALVYYLAKGKDGEYARRLQPFLDEAHKTDVVERFQKIFRVKDIRVFESEWHDFVRALNPADGVRMDMPDR